MRLLASLARLPLPAILLVLILAAPAASYPRPGETELVSLAHDGSLGTGEFGTVTEWPAVTPDGRYVAFHSGAPNLVPGDTNQRADIFVRDRVLGTTARVSVATDGTEGDHDSWAPRITPDGRFVAFESWSSSFAEGDEGWADVFVHDRQTGVTERISTPLAGGMNDESAFGPSITPDGRFVAFDSDASTLVPGDTNGQSDVFLHDRQTGETTRLSTGIGGTETDGFSGYPFLSADGRFVAFNSRATNLIAGDTNATYDTFVLDRDTGALERVSVASDGTEANRGGFAGMISADGRYVSFTSESTNLVPADGNGSWDVFVHDRETDRTRRVSVSSAGEEADALSSLTGVSPDGRFVLFWSDATNLVPGDDNGQRDVFLHDIATGTTELISVTHDDAGGNAMSWGIGSVTPGGELVGFMSEAANIVPNDTNGGSDVFLRHRGPSLGVRALSARETSEGIEVAGDATFSGAEVASTSDAPGDGTGPGAAGTDLIGAAVTSRPEAEDLLLRLDLERLPGTAGPACLPAAGCPPGVSGAPGVVYGMRFTVDGTAFEARAVRVSTSSGAAPAFSLYRCDDSCEVTVAIAGGIGTTGSEVRLAVPLDAVGAEGGSRLSGVEAFTALGGAETGTVHGLDQAGLGDVDLPAASVELGLAPVDTPAVAVIFDRVLSPSEGTFVSVLPSPGSGQHRVWARVCLGSDCRVASVPVA